MSGKVLRTHQSFSKLSIVIPVGPDDNSWCDLLKELTIFGIGIEIILSACQTKSVDIDLPKNVLWNQSSQGGEGLIS